MSASAPAGRPSSSNGSRLAVWMRATRVGDVVRSPISHDAATVWKNVPMLEPSWAANRAAKTVCRSGAHGDIRSAGGLPRCPHRLVARATSSHAGSSSDRPPCCDPARSCRWRGMRVMRVLSLVAGITLLVTGLASTIGRRADVGRRARPTPRDDRRPRSTEQLDATVSSSDGGARRRHHRHHHRAPGRRHRPARVRSDRGGDRACTSDIDRIVPRRSSVDAAGGRQPVGQPDPVASVVPDSLGAVVALDQGDARAGRRGRDR